MAGDCTRTAAAAATDCGLLPTAIYRRDLLPAGARLTGPAIIERESTTIWLPPATRATLDVYGNLSIDLEG